ncbi:aldo/keto reductase [Stanieria cyanosphaera PCC 7437]|uniref:Aldo/keto reductase n=1 Tax=Stanieria cyanosphaera (strain ATCC 29371 / PCC 7437) TaxID=111780 RepID=K9XS88_STAC7|nr:aldo/keto reductase [Stanieria cyanosphaera]AFZ35465.1 aldo/keto reductase [Stanieria cyanosphaera PCC 7437]
MLYRRFGKTNLNLSVFSLGTMRCLESAEVVQKTIATAIELGINHLETAKAYGKSEEYLGLALQSLALPRNQFYLTTKLPPTPKQAQIQEWLDQSLTRLKLDYLDCLAIHGINTWEHLDWVQSEGCLLAIQEAISQGKVRYLGFSTHGSLELILAAIKTNLFDFVNLHYYYFWQRNQAAIALAHQQDMGVFIISPADKGGKLYTPSETLQNLCRPFSPLELNYRFLLSDRRITTLSVGAAKPEELITPLQIADRDEPLNEQEQTVFRRLEAHFNQNLTDTRCSQCYQCLPCPEQINIPEVLRLRNLAVAYDMTDYGQYRYRMFENAGHWFPGKKGNRCTSCGDCLPRCPENLDIPTLLQDTHQRLNGSPRRRLWEE